jgi:hypothetical protein
MGDINVAMTICIVDDALGLTHYKFIPEGCTVKNKNACKNPPLPHGCSEKEMSGKMGMKQLISSVPCQAQRKCSGALTIYSSLFTEGWFVSAKTSLQMRREHREQY